MSALPADLSSTHDKPGTSTSTSTGGATATRNTGAATGGAVTITISGSSSTGTSTETSTDTATGAGAGKGAAKGKGKEAGKGADKKPDTGDKRPHVYNITVNSTGRSGDAVDSDETRGAPAQQAAKKKQAALSQGLSGLKTPGKSVKPAKSLDQK